MIREIPAYEQRETGCPYEALDQLLCELYYVHFQRDGDHEAAIFDSQYEVLDLIKRQTFFIMEILYLVLDLDDEQIAHNSSHLTRINNLLASDQIQPHPEFLKTGTFEKILQGIHEKADKASEPRAALLIYISLLYVYDNILGYYGEDFYQSCQESAANMLLCKLALVREDRPWVHFQSNGSYQTALNNALEEGMSPEQAIRLAQNSISPKISSN